VGWDEQGSRRSDSGSAQRRSALPTSQWATHLAETLRSSRAPGTWGSRLRRTSRLIVAGSRREVYINFWRPHGR